LGEGETAQGRYRHLSTKEHEVQHPSPYTALAFLAMFKQRRLNLTHEQFDECVDNLIAFLEELNDEKYRLEGPPHRITPES